MHQVQLSDLIEDTRRDAIGAADFIVLDALQQTCVEFFHQSGSWRERSDPASFSIGTFEYDFDVPYGAQAARCENVRLSSTTCPLTPVTESEFFALDRTAVGTPTKYAIAESTGTLLFWPTPDATATDTYQTLCVMTATREITQIPDAVGNRWRDGIIAGAVARLLDTEKRPWTNQALAAKQQQKFWDYVLRAKRESVSGQYVRPMRVQFQRFI